MFPLRDDVPRRYFPFMVLIIILINAVVFLWEIHLPKEWLDAVSFHLGLVPARYFAPHWAIAHGLDPHNPLPFLTAQFLHGGWMHIIGNMWVLWIFGPALEDRLGSLRFLFFYLLVGLGAMVVHVLINAGSTVPAIGASGAIAGVMGAYTLLFPRARILFFIPIFIFPFFFEWPAILFGLFWFLIQLLQGTQDLIAFNVGGGVAWWAHVGGFLIGAALAHALYLPASRRRPYQQDEATLGLGPSRL